MSSTPGSRTARWRGSGRRSSGCQAWVETTCLPQSAERSARRRVDRARAWCSMSKTGARSPMLASRVARAQSRSVQDGRHQWTVRTVRPQACAAATRPPEVLFGPGRLPRARSTMTQSPSRVRSLETVDGPDVARQVVVEFDSHHSSGV